ncbi:flagellar hook protein FlgE [Rhodomicrobium udaipurense JA643]|uniref:Flagellar hook protein FlgE n=1 Tax=Rhodomicrobium udaipurense TaxID=1202716 RepID=A0A8I1G7I3_9HYPH|nr:flagellar hook protein FlgE [Rhodomicrobium udaipurense]KAI95105.1 flagellar hook protein FlgE [Rhodomicrobium udaipurense JA643]MBJ7541998.1 flagellar hook protein FlgE [Rhodomicrobium udaipurense]
MSLYGLLNTSASGMAAQSTALSTVADNIANVSTTGYKGASTEFSTLVTSSGSGNYQSGGVDADVRVAIGSQSGTTSTNSSTDLAVDGNGFFIVSGPNGTPVLTRAGSFEKQADGTLENAAGYTLLGYPVGTTPSANSYAGLEEVNISDLAMKAVPSTEGTVKFNLPLQATAVTDATKLPSANAADATYTQKTSFTAYNNAGTAVNLDAYYTKTGDNTWEVSVYNQADATAGGFPYSSAALATETLTFDSTTYALTSPTSLSVPVPNGSTVVLDISKSTQLDTSYTFSADVNGNAASAVKSVNISDDGTLSVVYEDGSSVAAYTIPLAMVASPDNMTVISGNAYLPNQDSGSVQIGTAGTNGFGTISDYTLENSDVDLATELTRMIQSQNIYQSNAKVFQTGSDLLKVLVNLNT